MIFKWLRRLIFNNKKFSLFFVLNATLGSFTLIMVTNFSHSFLTSLHEKSKDILGADLSLSSRRTFEQNDLDAVKKLLPAESKTSVLTEMFTMIRSQDNSRLMALTVLDRAFPFYGNLELASGRVIVGGLSKDINLEKKAWVYPEVLVQMGLQLGDRIFIGDSEFEIADVVLKSSGLTGGLTELAPVIFIGGEFLADTHLVQKGSTSWRSVLYQLPPQFQNAKATGDFAAEIEKKITDPGTQVNTYMSASERTSQLIIYMTDYLGLVSILAMILSSLAVHFLCQSYLWKESLNRKILKILSLSAQKIFWIYQSQLMILTSLGTLFSYLLARLCLPKVFEFLKQLSVVEIHYEFSLTTVLVTWAVSNTVVFLVNAPHLWAAIEKHKILKWLLWASPLLPFWALSVVLAQSFKSSSIFVGSVVGLGLILLGFFFGLRFFLARSTRVLGFKMKHSLLAITRQPRTSCAIFIVFALTIALLNFLSLTEKALHKEMSPSSSSSSSESASGRPSLFLFDIQDEQVQILQSILRDLKIGWQVFSPMIQAKLVKVNGKPFERKIEEKIYSTRENEREKRSRNRTMNLSFRDRLSDSEKLVEGTLAEFNAGASLDKDYAQKIGVKIGDEMTFDILGVEISSRVNSLRQIHWLSFQPNFYILLPPALLADAPKTWLATLPPLSTEMKNTVQLQVTKTLANVSMFDVSRLAERLLQILATIGLTLKAMLGVFCLSCLFIIAAFSQVISQNKIEDYKLMKVIGLPLSEVVKLLLIENFLLLLLAVITGLASSQLLSWIASRWIFYTDFSWGFDLGLLIGSALILVSLFLILAFSWGELNARNNSAIRTFR